MLLELVEEMQSVRTACARMQMSYSSGWNLIRRLESQLNMSLVERCQGGAGGGKSCLTPEGKRLTAAYRSYSAAVKDVAAELYTQYFSEIFT